MSDINQDIEDLLRLRKEAGHEEMEWGAEPFSYYHPTFATKENGYNMWIDGGDDDWYVWCRKPGVEMSGGNITGNDQHKADAIYIAALHNTVPKLIERIRQLETQLDNAHDIGTFY